MRRKILATLLIASFGAMAATASAQNTAPNNSPRNAPVGTTMPAPADGSADPASGARNPAGTTLQQPGIMDSTSLPTSMTGYKSARAACDQQPVSSKVQCQNAVNARYSGVAPKCQKLSGAALDDCLKGADTGQ
jgi:hypothetical protein